MLSSKKVLEWLLLAFCLGNIMVTLHRSGIPLRLDGVVSRIEVRREKHPGLDDVYLVKIGERTVHLDTQLGEQLRRKEHVSKRAWQFSLQTPRGPVKLAPSKDFWRMLVWMPLLYLVSLFRPSRRLISQDNERGALLKRRYS